MTTELVLLLAIYAFIVIGVFLGDLGPVQTFKKSTPRLAAVVERNITIGTEWSRKGENNPIPAWQPEGNSN